MVGLGELSPLLRSDHPLALLVGLVGHQDLDYVGVAVLIHLLDPVLEVVERLFAGHVVDQQGPGRRSVITPGDAPEVLLARRVPDLELDVGILQFDHLGSELDSNGDVVVLADSVFDEFEH